MTELSLKFHVVFDLVKGHMTRAFDHNLNSMAPSSFREFSKRTEFAELSLICGIGETSGPEAVSN